MFDPPYLSVVDSVVRSGCRSTTIRIAEEGLLTLTMEKRSR
jgi:hypothetical protein